MRIAYSTLLPSESDRPDRFRRPPLAAGYLAAYTRAFRGDRDQHDIVDSDDLFELGDPDAITSRLLTSNPEVLGLTVFVWNHAEVARICRKCREANPEIRIVLGGPEVSYTPLQAFEEFDADWICTGEGEIPFLNLLNTLEQHPKSRLSLPGLLHRNDRESTDGLHGVLVPDLDQIPSPYAAGLISVKAGGWVDLETTRGCPYRCRFCLYGKTLESLRHFSLERVENDVAYAIKSGAHDLYLMDPTFNYPPERCMDICRLLASLNGDGRVRFSVEARAELMDETMADAFASAGVGFVEVGLQSSNRETLRLMKRGLGTTRFIGGCRLLRDRRIQVDIGVIVGLPGDNEDTLRRTTDFVRENGLGHLNIYRLQVLPGSEYHKLNKQLGIEYGSEPPYYVRSTPTLDEERIERLMQELRYEAADANTLYLADIGRHTEKDDCSRPAKWASKRSKGSPEKNTSEYIGSAISSKAGDVRKFDFHTHTSALPRLRPKQESPDGTILSRELTKSFKTA